MRVERASRAESTAASVSSRRSSGPCTDDRLVTTTTNVCTKCMLPKRPPSTGAHAHTKQPSQATILEETNDVFSKGLAAAGPTATAPVRTASPCLSRRTSSRSDATEPSSSDLEARSDLGGPCTNQHSEAVHVPAAQAAAAAQ
ncbi:uncharacterized protein LOC113214053 [Frankliniella occidentalis]|uniref:Uncharacterized protein LOC113214053 n=1 Tax=Frankliniella occidentalis TaxID=133901 RepID=A0A9C6UA98_FRAOC|nr:uncharacterized protein LOC113214053 [Frankliniella occidentalis]